jgi:polysaccharide export outer membrane protein
LIRLHGEGVKIVKATHGVLLLALFLTQPLLAQDASGARGGQTSSAPAASAKTAGAPPPAAADPAYQIGPDDVLNVSVWKEPTISNTVPVRPDGKISLALINDVQAAGLTPADLAMQIAEKLKKFITDPQVTVIVTAVNSQRVYVLGEVTRPGAFPMIPGMTVLQLLSDAGGFTAFANRKNIHVVRVDNGKQVKYPFNYNEALRGDKPDQNIVLKAGDTVVVP